MLHFLTFRYQALISLDITTLTIHLSLVIAETSYGMLTDAGATGSIFLLESMSALKLVPRLNFRLFVFGDFSFP